MIGSKIRLETVTVFGVIPPDRHHLQEKSKAILLSSEGKRIKEISNYCKKTERTIRNWFNGYESEGNKSFFIEKGRGIKGKLDNLGSEEIKMIKEAVSENYQNLKPACVIISVKLDFEVTEWMLRRY